MSARSGFSVMEALVAVALLAAAMIPIYDMVSALQRAALRLGEAIEAPFVEAAALSLLGGSEPYGSERAKEGELEIRGWQVAWRRNPISPQQTAGVAYGIQMSDIWLEELELVLTSDTYRQVSKHTVLGWRPRYESLTRYLMQADRLGEPGDMQ